MTRGFGIELHWERLETGLPEERACFAMIGIRQDAVCLTEAEDDLVGRVRREIPLSAYRLAEWCAWNWWRLRWEPHRHGEAWMLAHCLASVGHGFLWPNITMMSDGERIALHARPTRSRPEEPIRYLADATVIVAADAFENTLDRFFAQIEAQLHLENLRDTNFAALWEDLQAERADRDMSRWRRLEAMLGFDPDEADPALVHGLLEDAKAMGWSAVTEIAAHHRHGAPILTAREMRQLAFVQGYAASGEDAITLSPNIRFSGEMPAWRLGVELAGRVRGETGLGDAPLANRRLAELAGVAEAILRDKEAVSDFAFLLDDGDPPRDQRVVLRSQWETGRRFDLARLIGDRLATRGDGALFPATRGDTYRQKFQRAFAAELLCPFVVMHDALNGDYSHEALEDVARRFRVSDYLVRSHLVNHAMTDARGIEATFGVPF
ncbi:MAG: hypothetical protein HQM03_09170 [Magnetococcales bacterium]|nr:hypothetical protein [Magnetococcales bacterium]